MLQRANLNTRRPFFQLNSSFSEFKNNALMPTDQPTGQPTDQMKDKRTNPL